jgi:hypothetical protein
MARLARRYKIAGTTGPRYVGGIVVEVDAGRRQAPPLQRQEPWRELSWSSTLHLPLVLQGVQDEVGAFCNSYLWKK